MSSKFWLAFCRIWVIARYCDGVTAWPGLMSMAAEPLVAGLLMSTLTGFWLGAVSDWMGELRLRLMPAGRAVGLMVGTTGAAWGVVLIGTAFASLRRVGELDGAGDVPDEVAVPTPPGVCALAASGSSVAPKKIKAATAANRRRRSLARFFMDLLTKVLLVKSDRTPTAYANPNALQPL